MVLTFELSLTRRSLLHAVTLILSHDLPLLTKPSLLPPRDLVPTTNDPFPQLSASALEQQLDEPEELDESLYPDGLDHEWWK
jgi:hypothetical protein